MNETLSPTKVASYVDDCLKLRPKELIINDLKWKLLIRSVLRGRNILMVGPTGAGKTFAAKCVAEAMDRSDKFFRFNLGATQDPRSALIGNTHFNKDTGTFFSKSEFITAIQTENAVVLLDEISRAHPDAWNILMTITDPIQRYVRLDESDTEGYIEVAKGVTFIATANIGNEYTSTRQLDRAINDRFTKVEIDILSPEDEYELVTARCPEADIGILRSICLLSSQIRQDYFSENPNLTNFISTRAVVEMASLVEDGFGLLEVVEAHVYPEFSMDGGQDSERTKVKQIVQKYLPDDGDDVFTDPVSGVVTGDDEPPF